MKVCPVFLLLRFVVVVVFVFALFWYLRVKSVELSSNMVSGHECPKYKDVY